MVHVHLVDDGQVEVILDHALRDVGSQLGVADDLGHRARPPALVGGLELGGAADRSGSVVYIGTGTLILIIILVILLV